MPDSLKQITFETIVQTVLAIVVLIVCAGCIYAFVRAIYMFIFSHGEADKIKQAYSSIRFMILGILLTTVLLFAFPLILKRTDVPNADQYTAKNIFNRAGEVLRSMADIGTRLKNNQGNIQKGQYQEPAVRNYDL